MKVEIKHRLKGYVIYTHEAADDDPNPLRSAVVAAVSNGADLIRADPVRPPSCPPKWRRYELPAAVAMGAAWAITAVGFIALTWGPSP